MIALMLCLSPAFASASVAPSDLSTGTGVAGENGTAAGAAESVLRVYDLSSLDWSGAGEGDPLALNLLPGIDFWEAPKDGVSEDEGGADIGRPMEMIVTLFEDEFQYEGRRLEETGTGGLLVVGPPALHQRIELLIEYLESVIHGGAELAIDVWTLPAGADVPDVASVVPLADLQAWTGQLGGVGARHSSYALEVRPGRTGVLKLTRDIHAILDYDVEIAQGATIADPVMVTTTVGTRLAIRVAPSTTGLHMALTCKRGNLIDGGARRVHSGFLLSTSQAKPSFFDEELHITDVSVLSRSSSFATHLPTDHALVVETSADLERGGAREFLVVRQVGGSVALLESLQLDEEGGELVFANLGSIEPPSIVHDGVLIWPSLVLENLDRRLWKSPMLSARLRYPETGVFTDFLFEQVRGALRLEVQEPWLIVMPRPGTGGAPGAGSSRVRASFASMLHPTDVLDVRVSLEQGGREAVAARLPVRVGTSCGMVIGIEGFEQPDYDVEVAQFAATEDPVVHTALDGLFLFLDPLVESGGGLSLRIRGGGHLLIERDTVEIGGVVPGRVDQSRYAHLFVNDTVRLLDDGSGRFRRVFGEQAGRGGADELTLRIDVGR